VHGPAHHRATVDAQPRREDSAEREERPQIEPTQLIEPGQARRLAEARRSSGREVGELAALLGISDAAYHDLERFDEEIVDTISFDQVVQLADAIRLDLLSFFTAETVEEVSFTELAVRLRRLIAGGLALPDLEDQVGWELRSYLEEPATFGELPAIALADIGERVGLEWRSFLPRRT